jgi:hypothetical protein
MKQTIMMIATAALMIVISWAWASLDQSERSADQFSSDVASIWFEKIYDVVKVENTTPPPASRIYGITAVALYEAIVLGTGRYQSLIGQLNGLTLVPKPEQHRKYHWPTVANTVLATTIRGLYQITYQASLDAINALEQHFADQFSKKVPKQEYAHSVEYGQAVAHAILVWSDTDRFTDSNDCQHVPAPVPGAWEPTPPLFTPNSLQPCWGQIRPMVLTTNKECAPLGHPAFSTNPASTFYAAGQEVYNVGRGLTDAQKTIADYWSDSAGATGTPPGHWIAIVSQIVRKDGLSLAAAAEAYARVGIAVHDAFIVCWDTKYIFNLQRPVTYIQNNIDANWQPYLLTPAFPSYMSGHSTQSGAAARVLTDMFGIKRFRDTTHRDHGLVPSQKPRTFHSFDEAAAEAAVSRLYGGIHYTFDNNDGLMVGQCIGEVIRDRVRFK